MPDSTLMNSRSLVKSDSARLLELSRNTARAYQDLSLVGGETRSLGAKVRELIALSVSVAVRCDPCIALHSAAALRLGATRAEIAEALGIAADVNAGAAFAHASRALDAMDEALRR